MKKRDEMERRGSNGIYVMIFSFILLIGLVYALNITLNTPSSYNFYTNLTSAGFNFTIDDSALTQLNWSWNITNYKIYDSSLILFMNFDNRSAFGENDSRVVDFSGNSNNGTVINATYNSSGKYGSGISFDGVGDVIVLPDGADLKPTSITISMWFNPTQLVAQKLICMHWNDICLQTNTTGLTYNIYNLFSNRYAGTASAGVWQHVALTFDNTNKNSTIYVNGIMTDQKTNAAAITWESGSHPPVIGALVDTYATGFNGTIDEVRIYNRSLTSDEIYGVYISNLAKYSTSQWNFYINQSLNSTTALGVGTYGYSLGTSNSSGSSSLLYGNYTVDLAYPVPSFVSPTSSSGANVDSLVVNVSVVEANLANVTINLYNSTGIVNSSFSTSSIFYLNYSIPDNTYYVNATAVDLSGKTNSTETRTFLLDASIPQINFVSPTLGNDSYVNATGFIVNTTITESNLKNISLSVNGTTYWYGSNYILASVSNFTSGLVLLMNFDNESAYGESTTKAVDFSVFNKNGTITNAVWTSSGRFGSGISFDGDGDYIALSSTGSMYNLSGEMTISFWIKPQQQAGSYDVPYWNSQLWLLYTSNRKLMIEQGGTPGWSSLMMNTAMTQNAWNYITITKNTSDFVTMYLNGNSDKTGTLAITGTAVNSHHLGTYAGLASVDYCFNGTLDEFAVWNRTLSANEVTQLYQSSQIKKYGSDSYINYLPENNTNYSVQIRSTDRINWNAYVNKTNLANAIYSYLLSSFDIVGNSNSSSGTIKLDSLGPNATIINYANDSYIGNISALNVTNNNEAVLNFTLNVTDNLGIKNATLNIYNSTGLVNQTTTNFAEGSVTSVIGTVENLLEGVYNWWWDVFDWTGFRFNSENRTLTVDLTYPQIQFVGPTPLNNSGISGSFVINVTISETNLANVTLNWNGTITTFNNTNPNITNIGTGNWIFTYNQTGLAIGSRYNYNISVMDLAGNSNNTETRIILGNSVPIFSSISYSPSALDDLDPYANISVSVNVSDSDGNFDSAKIQWRNSTGSYGDNNITLTNITSMVISGLFNATLTLPSYETNVTFRIWANDSTGESATSANYSLWSYWDCTWNATSEFGAVAGWQTNNAIGNLTINNTGDVQFASNNCTLTFRLTHNLISGRIYFDNSPLKPSNSYSVSAKTNRTILVNASFLTEVRQESFTITTNEVTSSGGVNISESYERNTTGTLVSNQNGPYLYEKITTSPNSVYITSSNFSIQGYFTNLMGSAIVNENNTAYNVSFYWDLPSGLTNLSGETNVSYVNISDNNWNYINTSVGFSSLASFSPGVKTVNLKVYGYNLSGSLIVDASNQTIISESANITFLCYNVSDRVYVEACGSLDGDYSAPVTSSGSGTGGGGGFASGGGGGTTRADYQFVRGKTNEIIIPFANRNSNETLKGIKFVLSGEMAKYMEIVPNSLSELGPGQSMDIMLKVTSPGFIKLGQQIVTLEITGSTQSGNYNERKSIVLQVNDISKEEAFTLIENATSLIEEFSANGFNYSEVDKLILDMREAYEKLDYLSVKNDYTSLEGIVTSAIESKKIIFELNDLINQSKEKGIDVSGSERILKLAELSLRRNDYAEAYARAKEAQVTFALEVKGELATISYYLKNNKKEIGMSVFFLFVLGFAGYKGVSIRLLVAKIKKLKEEEKILHGLMKVVQRQTFTEKKMSMEEYGQAMQFYEKRLSDVVEQLIELESKRAHALRFTSDEGRLKVERDRIVTLIKEIQTEYLKRKTIETKSYELRLESYNRRLGQIDEHIATLEAKQALKVVLR